MEISLPGYSRCRMLSIVSGFSGAGVGSLVGVTEGVGGGVVSAIVVGGGFCAVGTGGAIASAPVLQAASNAVATKSVLRNTIRL